MYSKKPPPKRTVIPKRSLKSKTSNIEKTKIKKKPIGKPSNRIVTAPISLNNGPMTLNELNKLLSVSNSSEKHKASTVKVKNLNSVETILKKRIQTRKNKNNVKPANLKIHKNNKKYTVYARHLQDEIRNLKNDIIEINNELKETNLTKEKKEYLNLAIELKTEELEDYEQKLEDIKMGRKIDNELLTYF